LPQLIIFYKKALRVKKILSKNIIVYSEGELTMADQNAEAVNRMKVYIDKNIKEPITAKALSAAAGYSQYYAARIFKRHTGRMPFEYIRERRLNEAAAALRESGSRVFEVALDFVFDSHEGFTRAFANAFGITPKKYASMPVPAGWRIPSISSVRSKKNMGGNEMENQTKVIFTQIMERT